MISNMNKIITILALSFAFNLAQAADQIIATVDFKKVYGEYWRTEQADKQLKAKLDEAKKKIQKHIDAQEKLRQDILKKIQLLKDPKLGAVERSRRQRQVEARKKEFGENAGAIRDFQNATMKSLAAITPKAFGRFHYARLSDSNIAILLTGLTLIQATKLMESFRTLVEDQLVLMDDISFNFSISAGVAQDDKSNISDLLRQADNRLYLAKENGGNVVWSED